MRRTPATMWRHREDASWGLPIRTAYTFVISRRFLTVSRSFQPGSGPVCTNLRRVGRGPAIASLDGSAPGPWIPWSRSPDCVDQLSAGCRTVGARCDWRGSGARDCGPGAAHADRGAAAHVARCGGVAAVGRRCRSRPRGRRGRAARAPRRGAARRPHLLARVIGRRPSNPVDRHAVGPARAGSGDLSSRDCDLGRRSRMGTDRHVCGPILARRSHRSRVARPGEPSRPASPPGACTDNVGQRRIPGRDSQPAGDRLRHLRTAGGLPVRCAVLRRQRSHGGRRATGFDPSAGAAGAVAVARPRGARGTTRASDSLAVRVLR
jgi:hypothetical protein